ncbi:MAG: SLBB domain-containing protein [Saprospiraceae bacterium]
MLITAVLGKEVPSGGLPIATGVVTVNIATVAEIGRLLPHGRGIQERVVTISGPGVAKKGNYLIPIGTPLRFALEQVGVSGQISEVFLGTYDGGIRVQLGYFHYQRNLWHSGIYGN